MEIKKDTAGLVPGIPVHGGPGGPGRLCDVAQWFSQSSKVSNTPRNLHVESKGLTKRSREVFAKDG